MLTVESRERLQELMRTQPGPDLVEAALLVAKEEYQNLDLRVYLEKIEEFASAARRKIASSTSRTMLSLFSDYVAGELGFRGSKEDYYDPRNSYLNDVIDRRMGIPITLAIVYLGVSRRAGIPLFGVGLPGHFIIKYAAANEEILLDPFNDGRIITEDDCRLLMQQVYGGSLEFRKEFLKAWKPIEILTRLITNLIRIFQEKRDYDRLLRLLDLQTIINPEETGLLRDRGIIQSAMGRFSDAIKDLHKYLDSTPEAEDRQQVEDYISSLKKNMSIIS